MGAKAGRVAGRKAGEVAAAAASLEMGRDKVEALRKMFSEVGRGAGDQAGREAARAEAMRAVQEMAVRTAGKAAREKLLALAAKRKLQLSPDWKPTSLIAVINAR